MTVSIDVTAFDDTELGAEVRSVFAMGASFVALYDGTRVDQRASTWVDGERGLYRMHCDQGHVWLTLLKGQSAVFAKAPRNGECAVCGRPGEWMDD